MVKKALIVFLIFILCLGIGELLLSVFITFPNDYYVATPNTQFVWKADSLLKGINEDATVSFNDLGARSTKDYKSQKSTIIALGGSTTASYSLDQSKTWTGVLEGNLKTDTWLGNFGKQGNHSFHHVAQLTQLLKNTDIPPIKVVIILMGINDFSACLINQDRYSRLNDYDIKLSAFAHLPNHELPWYRRFTLVKLLKRAKNNLKALLNHSSHGELLLKHSQLRSKAKKMDSLPDLEKGLDAYEENTKALINMARKEGIQIVFIKQPSLWSDKLTEDEEKLLYGNKTEGDIHYTTATLAAGLDLFNNRLEKVCQQEKVLFIDTEIEPSSANFFDDCHFTELGAKRLANEIHVHLKESGLIE